MKEICVGVVGCGELAQKAHLRNLKELPRVRLKWACDINPVTLEAVQRNFEPERVTADYREVTDDPEVDGIVIATRQDLRLPLIRAAADRRKAVYCEKPMADTLSEMEEIQRIVEDTGIVFCVGHNRRSAPAIEYALDIFRRQRSQPKPCRWRPDRNTALRQPWPEERQAVALCRINDDLWSWKPWAMDDATMAHGPMLFEMTHFTDLLTTFIGARPVEVLAAGHLRTNQSVTITYDDGSIGVIVMTGVGTFGYPKELYEFYANGGAVIVDHFVEVRTGGIPDAEPRRAFPLRDDRTPDVSDGGGIRDFYAKTNAAAARALASDNPGMEFLAIWPEPDKGHKRHLERWLDAIRGKGESPCGVAESVLATRVAFAAIDSLRSARPVAIETM